MAWSFQGVFHVEMIFLFSVTKTFITSVEAIYRNGSSDKMKMVPKVSCSRVIMGEMRGMDVAKASI